MHFLVPAFAAFVLLAGVPVLVHLYGRPRAERRRFAAIRFLIESDRKTAARRRLREVALLCARAAAIAAVPLLLAKPFLETRTPIAATIGERESAVIVLDDSRSMGQRGEGLGGGTRFAEAQARARRLVAGLGRDSEAAVLLTSQGAAAPQAELTADRTRLAKAITDVRLGARPGDTTAALRRAAAILGAATPAAAGGGKARKVYLVSDLAAHGWGEGAPWGDDGPSLVPIDVGGDRYRTAPRNRAVVEVRVAAAPQLGPRGVEITATVANHGGQPEKDVGITLRVDGRAVAKGLLDLPARGRADKRFFHVFADATPGNPAEVDPAAPPVHDTVVELDGDELGSDDRRYLRIEERRGLRVLLLDGDPRTVRRDDELFYLETALRPGDRDDSHIALRITTPEELPRVALGAEDVIFAANVKAPDPDRAGLLRRFVEGGGGLFLSVGDNVEPDAWNAALGDLLPQPLATLRTVGATLRTRDDGESVVGGSAAPGADGEHVARLDREHPVLAPFEGGGVDARGAAQALREARVGRFALLRPTPEASTPAGGVDRRALLRLDSGAPLLVEGRLGKGRVLLLTTTIDRDWADLAIQPGFLPLVQQSARYLARAALEAPEPPGLVGQPHDIPLADGDARVEVTLPDGTTRAFGEERVAGRPALHFTETEQPGLYHVAFGESGGGMAARPTATFAVDVDAAESDLAPVEPVRLAALARPGGGSKGGEARHRLELWHELGALLLALLLLEGLLTLRR